ncbi:MAG: gamma-butyrobetaine hydroxylase-like domain-containing protein [Pseudomonadota bacterium]
MKHIPSAINLKSQSQQLEVIYPDHRFLLGAEYLRQYSPSAEVRGHGNEPRKYVAGKKHVKMLKLEPVGHYAIKIVFDDRHDTGLYDWDYLYELGKNFEQNWHAYLKHLDENHLSREPGSFKDAAP